MPSKTDVVNVALRFLGANRISSLTEGTKPANVMNDIYDEVRKEMLRFPWNFGTKRQKLAQSTTVPTFEFDYAYPVPADWIYTISVHDNDAGLSTVLYREEEVNSQVAVVTSSDQVYMRFVYDVEDPNIMSAGFRRALSSALARDAAIALTSSNRIYESMAIQAQRDKMAAQAQDGFTSFPEQRPAGSWVTSRHGWRDGRGSMGI